MPSSSAPVKAKVLIGLGVVLGGGKGKKDEAKKAFVEALKLGLGGLVHVDGGTRQRGAEQEDQDQDLRVHGPGSCDGV